MLSFLKSAVDDASADQRTKVFAIYAVLLTANALVWVWALDGVAACGANVVSRVCDLVSERFVFGDCARLTA
jgi:hypothetical protein